MSWVQRSVGFRAAVAVALVLTTASVAEARGRRRCKRDCTPVCVTAPPACHNSYYVSGNPGFVTVTVSVAPAAPVPTPGYGVPVAPCPPVPAAGVVVPR